MLMKYFLIILFLTTCTAANAATTKLFGLTSLEMHAVVADTDTVVREASVSLVVNYGSDIQFFGRTGPVKYPFASADAVYNLKSGFFVYGSAVQVFGYTPIVDEIDAGGGYLFKYSKKATGTFSYTHFFFTNDAPPVIISASSNDIDFKNSFDWKFVKTSATFDYLFGQANDYFVTLNISKYIETSWSIFDDQDYLTFNPGISMITGTQNFVGRYSSENSSHLYFDNDIQGLNVPPPFVRDNDYDNGRFNILNYSFKLPIAYNRPHYTFEASWKYSIPLNVEGALKNHNELFFNLTFYYLFFK
jgi:hypothetical protein